MKIHVHVHACTCTCEYPGVFGLGRDVDPEVEPHGVVHFSLKTDQATLFGVLYTRTSIRTSTTVGCKAKSVFYKVKVDHV